MLANMNSVHYRDIHDVDHFVIETHSLLHKCNERKEETVGLLLFGFWKDDKLMRLNKKEL